MLSKIHSLEEKKRHTGFSVTSEELCSQQHTGELTQASEDKDHCFLDAQEN